MNSVDNEGIQDEARKQCTFHTAETGCCSIGLFVAVLPCVLYLGKYISPVESRCYEFCL